MEQHSEHPSTNPESTDTSVEAKVGGEIKTLPAELGFHETPELVELRGQAMEAPFGSAASSSAFGEYHRTATDMVMQLPPGPQQDHLDFAVQVQMWLLRRAAGQEPAEVLAELDELHEAAWSHPNLRGVEGLIEAELQRLEHQARDQQ